jgi:hypothetical protein
VIFQCIGSGIDDKIETKAYIVMLIAEVYERSQCTPEAPS